MHLNSKLLFQRYAAEHFHDGQRVLEIGADADPSTHRQQLDGLRLRWETADIEGGWTRPTYLMPTEYAIPVPDATFDVVFASQVIEHVRQVWRWMRELVRVTRPGGTIILISPISWPYHEAPIDCWRIYPEGMRALCDEVGLEVVLCESHALEPTVSRRPFFGETATNARRGARIKQLLGWPTPRALDLVTVARRR